MGGFIPAVRRFFHRTRPYLPWCFNALLAVMLGALASAALVVFQDIPQIQSLKTFEPKSIHTLYDMHDQPAYEYFDQRRIPLSQNEIPPLVADAFRVAEDWDFYTHFGIDLKGLLRAVVTNIVKGRLSQGASTITQQLARNLFLNHQKTIARKLKEAYLTLRIERSFTKQEILTMYLNQIYLGEGTYGIAQASLMYFGKPVTDLGIAEIALLAALPKNPNIYSPFRHPDKALARRNLILRWMAQREVISAEQMRVAMEQAIPDHKQNVREKQNYFTHHVYQKLTDHIPLNVMEQGGLSIFTPYDPALQRASEQAAQKAIRAYAQRHKLDAEKDQDQLPQIASISMDVRTGGIRAMVGGRNFAQSLFNRALLAKRQPGSSIKPLLYALGIDQGYTQSSFLLDAPIEFDHPQFGRWAPENYDHDFAGYLPMRRALEKSKNTTSVRLLQSLGVGNFHRWLRLLGITEPVQPNLTIALGSSSVTLPELAKAYATFANGGLSVTPYTIDRVTRANGETWLTHTPQVRRVLSQQTAFITTDMLLGVVQDGSGRFANDIDCKLAGKTGTTNNYVDSVFAGFSRDLVTITWVGFDDNRTLGFGETGSKAAGRFWADIMRAHCEMDQPGDFDVPEGIEMVTVDHTTGLLPSAWTIDFQAQAYLPGTAPTQSCCAPKAPETK
jgi:penicillin-binding protein 1A